MAANNTVLLKEIIDQMELTWFTNCCVENKGVDPCPSFHFGYPQDVDDIHKKDLPLLVVNVPTSTSVVDEYEKNVVNKIYQFKPSRYNVIDDVLKAEMWDAMEDCFYNWLNNFLVAMGSPVVLGSGVVQISRRTQSSNDQLLQIEVTFNLNYFRRCMSVKYPSGPPD